MTSGRFFAVQERPKGAASTVPWSFYSQDTFATAEQAMAERDVERANNGHLMEFRAVAVHVTTEIETIQ